MLDAIQFRFALSFGSCMTADQLRNAVVPKSNTRPRAHHSSQPRTPHWTETVRLWFREIRAIQRNTWPTSILHSRDIQSPPEFAVHRRGMGYDAQCDIRFDGQTVRAKAVLEQRISSCGVRCASRFHSLESPRPPRRTAGCASLRRPARRNRPRPGAEKWAQRITNPPSRLAKLGVKAGVSGSWSSARSRRVRRRAGAAGATVLRRMGRGTTPAFDVIFSSVERRESRPARGAKVEDRVLGSNLDAASKRERAITEADTMAAGKRAGLVDVKVVSFSDM